MSMFRSIRFLYTIFIVVMIYLRINLKLKLLLFPTGGASREREGEAALAAGGCGGRAPRRVRSVQEGPGWPGRPCPGQVRPGSNSVGHRALLVACDRERAGGKHG
jgi:hypothetical protein